MLQAKPFIRCICVLSLIVFQPNLYAIVIDFDDIAVGPAGYEFLPGNYDGLSWRSDLYVVEDSLYATYGNTYGSPSGENAVFNGFGVISTGFSATSSFDYTGASVAGWGYSDSLDGVNSATTLTMEGYRNGSLVASRSMRLSGSNYQLMQADFIGVDEVRFISSDEGKWWVMDDITINETSLPQIARREFNLDFPFDETLPISMPVSTPAIGDLPDPDKLTAANLSKFLEEHGDEFDLGTRLVLKTLAGTADVPILGLPVGIAIDAILNPSEQLKKVSSGAHASLEAAQFWKNLWDIGELLEDGGGAIENLSNSQTLKFYGHLFENFGIASEELGVDFGPLLSAATDVAGYVSDAVSAFKFSAALYVGDPLTATLIANEKIWFDLVSDQLGILGIDPIDPSYTQAYIPSEIVRIEIPETGNPEFQQKAEDFLSKSLLYYTYLEALNTTFDRYTAAYLEGDSISATLQLQAWLYYLNLLYETAQVTLVSLESFQSVLSDIDVARSIDILEAETLYGEILRAIELQQASPEALAFLTDTFDISKEEFQDLVELSFKLPVDAPIEFLRPGSSVFDIGADSLRSFINLGSRQSVPEPPTILLLLFGYGLIGFATRRRHRTLHSSKK